MKANYLVERNAKQSEGVVVTKIGFRRKRQDREIFYRAYVLRRYPEPLHLVSIERDAVVDPLDKVT